MFECLSCYVRMPKLRETYLQIQERNAREIRQRTRERVRALHRDEERVIVVLSVPTLSVETNRRVM